MNMNTETACTPSIVSDVRALMTDLNIPRVIALDDKAQALLLPKGYELSDASDILETYRSKPLRRRTRTVLHDLDSFILHINTFADPDSAIFANGNTGSPRITAIYDHDRKGPIADEGQRHGDNTAVYCPHLSDEWQAWAGADGHVMSHRDFAELIEDRIGDVLPPPVRTEDDTDAKLHELVRLLGGTLAGPTKLLELSRGLKLQEDTRAASATNLSSGEVEIAFETTHRDSTGAPIKVPNLFLIAVPVFQNGPLYRFPVRLRYRLKEGTIRWIVQRYRPEITFKAAFDEELARIRTETSATVYLGEVP